MKSIKCTGCGANVKFNKNGTGTCEYCNTEYYAKDFFETNVDPISTSSNNFYRKEIKYFKTCKNCSHELQITDTICPYCGQEQDFYNNASSYTTYSTASMKSSNSKEKNKAIALLLCIFFGVYGAHKFYEGKIGMGILYLCTGGILGIGWVIDIFILLLKPRTYYV